MDMVETTQYQAALAVAGSWQGTSCNKFYEELGWVSLSDGRICKRVLQIYNICDRKSPDYLHRSLPLRKNVLIDLPNIFQEIWCRTDRYKNSFFINSLE